MREDGKVRGHSRPKYSKSVRLAVMKMSREHVGSKFYPKESQHAVQIHREMSSRTIRGLNPLQNHSLTHTLTHSTVSQFLTEIWVKLVDSRSSSLLQSDDLLDCTAFILFGSAAHFRQPYADDAFPSLSCTTRATDHAILFPLPSFRAPISDMVTGSSARKSPVAIG